MISECRNYLIEQLKSAGIKSHIYTNMKELSATKESHIGAVLFEKEEFARNGSKTTYEENGAKYKRVKKLNRNTVLHVIIGEYDQLKCETIFNSFLSELNNGIIIDKNYVEIDVGDADWVEKEDSVLVAKVAVQVTITFKGGIYKDTQYKNISSVDLEYEMMEV